MFKANCYNIMIVSPSDVIQERKICQDVIIEWNIIHLEKDGIILNPIGWEINSYPETGKSPQEILNRQLLEKADILIAIFWTRIGTPTKEYPSGSIEEISKHIENGKPALIYFSNGPVTPGSYDQGQFEKLQEYKESIQNKSYYKEYTDIAEFKTIFSKDIQLLANDSLSGYNNDTPNPAAEIEENYSRTKMDAIDFVSKIPSFDENSDNLRLFLDQLGNYRSLQLNPFFDKLKIMHLQENSMGTIRPQIRGSFKKYSSDDIKLIIQDIKDGNFDEYL